MAFIIWKIFTEEWLKRAERGEYERVDDADRFISLWIAFNGWMKGKFGERKRDTMLLNELKQLPEFNNSFNHLRKANPDFRKNLKKLANYSVGNMQRPENGELKYDGKLDSLIEILYRVRCNLFHGRKEINGNAKDKELVSLSLKILLPLFKTYLSMNKPKEKTLNAKS